MGRLDEASETIAHALAMSRECGDKWYVANGLNVQAAIERNRG